MEYKGGIVYPESPTPLWIHYNNNTTERPQTQRRECLEIAYKLSKFQTLYFGDGGFSMKACLLFYSVLLSSYLLHCCDNPLSTNDITRPNIYSSKTSSQSFKGEERRRQKEATPLQLYLRKTFRHPDLRPSGTWNTNVIPPAFKLHLNWFISFDFN